MTDRDAPVLRRVVLMADGSNVERTWTLDDLTTDPPHDEVSRQLEPPVWLRNPHRAWTAPGDPVTLYGDVILGHEAEALAWLGVDDAVEQL